MTRAGVFRKEGDLKALTKILNRFTGSLIFEAEVDGGTESIRLGLAAKLAYKGEADLRGADLRGANLYGADLRGADLREADLRGANLGEADLRGANLREADLREADLGEADLGGANLRGADLRGANLYGADLRGANLRGANLRGANLYGANLGGANLYRADLYEADLREADLRGANLYGADLYGADLRGANLRGANLHGADLGGANLGEDVKLVGDRPILQIGPIGSRSDYLTAFFTDRGIYLRTGCFFGTLVEFRASLAKTHDGNTHATEYEAALHLILRHRELWKGEESPDCAPDETEVSNV